VLRNELICNAFYKANLIESWGRGTVEITKACLEARLPAPEFREAFGGFEIIFHQDNFTEKHLRELGLNDRQIKAVLYLKDKTKITNVEYRRLVGSSERTASRDLADLVMRNILVQKGTTGRGTEYFLP